MIRITSNGTNGGFNMTVLLRMMKNTTLAMSIFFAANSAFAEAPKNDAHALEEMNKYADENSKMREDHIQQMREVHLKHVNDMYDRKSAHNKEMAAMWKQLKPGDKAGNKTLREQIKNKHEAFEKEEEKFRDDFKENVLKKRNKEFRESMKTRQKEMKNKYKD